MDSRSSVLSAVALAEQTLVIQNAPFYTLPRIQNIIDTWSLGVETGVKQKQHIINKVVGGC